MALGLDAWVAAHYARPADDNSIVTAEQAVQHSLSKWRGLRADVLYQHGVSVNSTEFKSRVGCIDSSTCALCIMFDLHIDLDGCCNTCHNTCPLALARGGFRCDIQAPSEQSTPYETWLRDKDPEPMIAALEAAQAFLNEGQNEQE